MNRTIYNPWPVIILVVFLGVARPAARADLWETLGLKKRTSAITALTEDQIASGLREALAQGVQKAVSTLGQTNGFLGDAAVRIPLPNSLQRTESTLRALGQQSLVDEFRTTLNRAAEQAVPEAAAVLGDAVRQMTVQDARAILNSTNTAATDFFRRTSQTNLHARFLPIVKQATEQTGVTARYKGLLEAAGVGGTGFLGNLGRSVLGTESLDLDDYVTRKAMDGLFLKIGDEERRIRENPTARASELLQKVFGQVSR